MKKICEKCSKNSNNETVCNWCGSEIAQDKPLEDLSDGLIWGYALLNLETLSKDMQNDILDNLKPQLENLEELTILSLIPSQLKEFELEKKQFKILIRKNFYSQLISGLPQEYKEVIVNFAPIGYFQYASELEQFLKHPH